MSYELIIPDNATVPAYALLNGNGAAAAANEDAGFGISSGMPPRIKISAKTFALVNEAGEVTPIPPGKLTKGPDDNLYLQVIVLRAKRAFTKVWYAAAYNPNDDEHAAPDCMSTDGERPDAGVFSPQSELCATCPQNAFGTGTDQNGNPTKGKACTDNKILAVFVPSFGVHQLKLPPASLRNWGQYVRELTKRNFNVGAVITLVGFDLTSDFPQLVFQFGGFVPEKSLAKVAEYAQAPEVDNIINPMGLIGAPAPKAIAAPAPVVAPEVIEAPAEPPPAAKPKGRGRPAAAAPKEPPPPAAAAPANDGLDLGLDEPPMASQTAPPTDDELADALGL